MPESAANRKTIRRKEKAARLADTQRQEVLTSIMSTAPGRQWLWDLLASCHCFHTTFTGDALASAFSEGQRAVGLHLLSDILTACPDSYLQAQRESNDRSATNERRSRTESDGGDHRPDDSTSDDHYNQYRDPDGNPAFDGYDDPDY